mmetsp:Transcript_22910/g.31349  ORF Transcript_22910/g.31349 Transcript_22910/m.31349 type:complete len:281 (-) Transcript_22910:643-1485(-)
MNTNGIVKLLLSGTHFHSNTNALNHFSCSICGNMHTYNFVGVAVNNDLKQRIGLRFWERVFHSSETRFVDSNILIFLRSFLFGITDRPDLRGGKNGRCDPLVIALAIEPSEESVGQPMTFHQSHRSQSDPVRHISNCVDVVHVRLRVFVDRDETPFLSLHSSTLKVQTFGFRISSRRVHDLVCDKAFPIPRDDRQRTVLILYDLFGIGVELEVHAGVRRHLFSQVYPHVVVESSKEVITPVHKCHVASESVHDGCELDSNESPTNNYDSLRLFFEIENLV